MSKTYIKYLRELNKIKDITNEDLKNVFVKYYKTNNLNTGSSLFNNLNLKIVLSLLNKIYQNFYRNDNTVKSYFSAIRTAIKKKYGLSSPQYILSLDILKQPAGTKEKLDTAYKLQVKEKNRNKIVFYLEDIYKIIDEALFYDNIFYKNSNMKL